MKFYIDPGTGSMLFTILIGILGALRYVFKWLIILSLIFIQFYWKENWNSQFRPIVFPNKRVLIMWQYVIALSS